MPSQRPVVLFAAGLSGNGVARNTVHLANALARRGLPVEVVCLAGGALAADLAGPHVTCLGRGRGPRALALARAVPALRRRLAELDPSVVVSMGNHAHAPVWAALRGRIDTPRIYRISNDPQRDGEAPARRRLREANLRLLAADATRLVCVSGRIAAAEPFRRARRDGRVEALPNGVDVAAVRGRAAATVRDPWLDDRGPLLLAVGRVHRQKNYGALIDALAIARSEGRPDLRLLVLGAAEGSLRGALERRAAALGLRAAVRFEGEVANPFPYMARASAYVLPSLWEGSSNSLLEALACGAPIVASRTAGDAVQVLDGGRFGALADPRDPHDFAGAILDQHREDRRRLPGRRAEAFALDRMTDRFTSIVLGARSAHDEIQMQAEEARHLAPLSPTVRGRTTEY